MSEMAVSTWTTLTRTTERIQMRIIRALAGSATVIAAVAGVGLATAGAAMATDRGPAAAANVGGAAWKAYGNHSPVTASTDEWLCEPTITVGKNVFAQLCEVFTNFAPSQGLWPFQGAVIVRNDKPVTYNAAASIQLTGPVTSFSACGKSGVAPQTWSVCFSPTFRVASNGHPFVTGTINGDVFPDF